MLNETELKSLYDSLSFEEKLGQLLQLTGNYYNTEGEITGIVNGSFTEEQIKHAGSILNTYGVERLTAIQKEHLKHNKIPMIFMGDVISGYTYSLPSPLALSCSFDTDLVYRAAAATAEACTADGVSVNFSPMIDISRDARWGRVLESYGEDKYLTSQMGTAVINGYQNNSNDGTNYLSACIKHFAAYGYCEAGRDYNNVELSERALKETFLVPYEAAVKAGCDMVMSSFNTIGGIPMTINKKMTRDLLRDEWGFNGTIISDWASLYECIAHRAVNNEEQLAELGLEAGIDIDMMSPVYNNNIPKLKNKGLLNEKRFEEAVMNVLRLKNKQGLLEDPYKYLKGKETDKQKQLEIAEETVIKSCVLLKNEDILPIESSKSIALIGPFINDKRVVSMWTYRHTVSDNELSSFAEAFENMHNQKIKSALGCSKLSSAQPLFEKYASSIDRAIDENKEKYLSEAVKIAKESDVAVVFLGEHYEENAESCSKAEITIAEQQLNLLREVNKVNKNIITVVFSGRPLDLREVTSLSKAVIFAWQPGDLASIGIAKLLLGHAVPSAKLAMSLPYCTGQCPIHYDRYPTGRPHKEITTKFLTHYVDAPIEPLYPFGYGLSYTKFDYSNITATDNSVRANKPITLSVDVTNNGEFDAEEVVQLYLSDSSATMVSRPLRELKGFKKVFIKKKETVTVEFTITEEMLRFLDYNFEITSEAGEHTAYIGGDSTCKNSFKFTLIKN